MSHTTRLCALLAACCVLAGARAGKQNNGQIDASPPVGGGDPVAETPAGRVRGSWMETRDGRRFEAYRGIRYAHPPIGELRFQPPVLVTRYSGEVRADEEGPACPQPALTPAFVVHEDCLRLNVYTPRSGNRSPPLPVVVYIHPGGFYSGSGRSDVAGPHYLLERDLVLVTINYRLGTLGFLSTGDALSPGNNGLKDQVAALRWVQRNIRAFGGDPALVTLLGYSAGSLSIALHMLSPMGRGLFHRAISMSASPFSQVVVGTEQRHLAARQATLLGCPNTTHTPDHTARLLACLKSRPWEQFADSLDDMFEFGYDPVLMWNAVVEGASGAGGAGGAERYLPEPPLQTLERGGVHAVPYIVSQTKDEFFWKAFNVLKNASLFSAMSGRWSEIAPIAFMLPPRAAQPGGANATTAADTLKTAYFGRGGVFANDSRTAAALGELYSDAIIGFAAHRLARLMSRHSPAPLYQYEFTYVGEHSHYKDPSTGKPTGAAHHDELIYLFSLPAVFPAVPRGGRDDVIVQRITALVYNFAKHGDPNPREHTPELAGMRWPRYTPEHRRYLRFGDNFTVDTNLFEHRYDVWNQLYPVHY